MRKKVNFKLLGMLLGSMALFAIGAHFLHAFQVKRNASAFLTLADGALEEGKKQKAADYLGRYLTLKPADVDARARFGLLLADEKLATSPRAILRAYMVLGQVLVADPSRHDVRRRVVEIAMDERLQRFRDAGEHLRKLLDAFPDDGKLLGLRARCHEASGEYTDARAKYEEAIAHNPDEIENYLQLVNLCRNRAGEIQAKGESAETLKKLADKHMDAMVNANPRNFKVYLARARYRKEFARPSDDQARVKSDIERDVRKAQQLAPEDVDVSLSVADLAIENKDPEAARKLLRAAIALPKNAEQWRLIQALSRLEMFENQPEAALACLRDGLKRMPDQFDLLWNFAYLLIHQRHEEEAADVIIRLEKAGIPKAHLRYLEARRLVNRENWLMAARVLESAYPSFINGNEKSKDWFSYNLGLECNLLLGNCYEQMGDPDHAASAYGRVLGREPGSVPGRLGLARTKSSLGQYDAAEQEYRKLIGLANVPATVWLELVQLLIEHNLRTEQADWSEVEQLLKQIEKLPVAQKPAPAGLALLSAEILVARKEYDEARRRLESLRDDKQIRPAEIFVGLANLEMRRGRNDAALTILDDAVKQHGDRVELRFARIRYWGRRGGPEAAKELAQLGQNLGNFTGADQVRLLRGLADAHAQTGALKEATRLWQQIAEQRPTDISCRLALFDLALMNNDSDAMPRLAAEIGKLEGAEGSLSLCCMASYRIWQADRGDKRGLTEAAQYLKTVFDRRPGLAHAARIARAMIDELQLRPEEAIANYKLALSLGEQRPAVIRRLVRLLTGRGHHLEAEEVIRKLRAQSPNLLVGLERESAEVAIFGRNTVQALELARKAVPIDSKDYRDHVWLGRILWAAGSSADAEDSLRRALALNDQVPETWVALVQHLVRTDNKKQAESIVRQAEEKLPKGKFLLDLAQCYDMIGKANRASELYAAALAAQPDNAVVLYEIALVRLRSNKLEDAMKHLQQIIRLKTSQAIEEKAHRTLAILMHWSGDYRKSLEALKSLENTAENAPQPGDSLADRRARVVILASQPSSRKRREAIGILHDFVRTQVATTDEKFLLAQLCESVGEWTKTRSQMTELLSMAEERLTQVSQEREKKALNAAYGSYLTYFSLSLLRRGELADAKFWQAKLERLEPDSFGSLEVKARLLGKQSKSVEALPFLKNLVAKQNASVLPVAKLLEQLGENAAALEMYERFVAQTAKPDAVLILAAFLGRQDRPGEALAICEKAWKSCPPDAVSGVSVAILYTAKSGITHAARVATWLEQAIAKHPETATRIMRDLAAVRRLQGRTQDAVDLFRQINARDKSDALTLNNLAWLLALGGKADEALEMVETAITLRGEMAALLDTRAVAHLAKGRYKLAMQDLVEAIAETPTAHRHFHLAQAYFGVGNHAAALDALNRAKDLGLDESSVDPLERDVYHQLRAKLDRPGPGS